MPSKIQIIKSAMAAFTQAQQALESANRAARCTSPTGLNIRPSGIGLLFGRNGESEIVILPADIQWLIDNLPDYLEEN